MSHSVQLRSSELLILLAQGHPIKASLPEISVLLLMLPVMIQTKPWWPHNSREARLWVL
ncbi:TPA: hypothetical protein ACTXXA_001089 [Legionella anisa]